MKKTIYLTICSVLALVSCGKNQECVDALPGKQASVAFNLFLSTKAASPAPTVNSVRVLAFDTDGYCTLNEYLEDDFTVAEVTDGYTVTLDETYAMGISNSDYFTVYAILNEGDYILEGTESTISSLISAIAVGEKKHALFKSYYASSVKCTPAEVTGSEPAFIMGASAALTVTEGASVTPCTVTFSQNLRRSMAEVTVNAITSAPVDGVDYSSGDVAEVFVVDVELVNIPTTAAWGSANGKLGAITGTLQIGSANSDGYYDRSWDGSPVTAIQTVNVTRTQETDATLYRCVNDKNVKTAEAWAFNRPCVFTTYQSANENKNACDDNTMGVPNLDSLRAFFNVTSTSYVKNSKSGGLKGLTFTDGYWTVNLGQSFYVPENVTSDPETATCIRVRAAIAEPTADIPLEALPEPTSLNEADSDLNDTYRIFQKVDRGVNVYTELTSTTTFKNGIKNLIKVVGSEDHSTIVKDMMDKHKSYHVIANGFSRVVDATSDLTVDLASYPEVEFEWNVPVSGSGHHIYDFLIPVNNQAYDSDYSVRRNTKYSVTLHVEQSTYDDLVTKAAASSTPFTVKASVTTEKMTGYEEE